MQRLCLFPFKKECKQANAVSAQQRGVRTTILESKRKMLTKICLDIVWVF